MELIIYSQNLEVYINDGIVLVDYFIDQVLHIYSKFNGSLFIQTFAKLPKIKPINIINNSIKIKKFH